MSSAFLSNPLPWVLPPFLGAAIGYVTNALAIRMLFRPLKAKRIFGIRLPLTPGIIPKQRSALADSIGRMVSEQLINVETLQSKIESDGFRRGVDSNISDLSTRLLATPLGRLRREQWTVFYESLDNYLAGTLHRFFSSDRFQAALKALLTELLHSLAGRTLGEVANREKLRGFLEERVIPTVMQDGRLRALLLEKLGVWLDAKLRQNVPIDTLVPQEVVKTLAAGMRSLLPSLLEALFRHLRSQPLRGELESKGRRLLRGILDKLNNFQRFFISVGQYDRTLDEKMPEILEEALEYFEASAYDPQNQDKMVQAVEQGLEDWRKKGLADAVFAAGFDIQEALTRAAAAVLDKVGGGDGASAILDAVDAFLVRNAGRTLGDLLQGTLGLSEEDVIAYVSDPLIRALSRQENADAIAGRIIAMAERYLQENPEATVGELLGVNEERKARLVAFATTKLLDVMNQRLPALIASFDIRQLVEDKINSLDVAQVEKLLMIVIAKHLKWINVFGAILGAIIGMSQVILNLVR